VIDILSDSVAHTVPNNLPYVYSFIDSISFIGAILVSFLPIDSQAHLPSHRKAGVAADLCEVIQIQVF